jgi:hypothetical protein
MKHRLLSISALMLPATLALGLIACADDDRATSSSRLSGERSPGLTEDACVAEENACIVAAGCGDYQVEITGEGSFAQAVPDDEACQVAVSGCSYPDSCYDPCQAKASRANFLCEMRAGFESVASFDCSIAYDDYRAAECGDWVESKACQACQRESVVCSSGLDEDDDDARLACGQAEEECFAAEGCDHD